MYTRSNNASLKHLYHDYMQHLFLLCASQAYYQIRYSSDWLHMHSGMVRLAAHMHKQLSINFYGYFQGLEMMIRTAKVRMLMRSSSAMLCPTV